MKVGAHVLILLSTAGRPLGRLSKSSQERIAAGLRIIGLGVSAWVWRPCGKYGGVRGVLSTSSLYPPTLSINCARAGAQQWTLVAITATSPTSSSQLVRAHGASL